VIATQNPMEFQGVYPLAESQLDRFMVQLVLDTPDKQDELAIYRGNLSQNDETRVKSAALQGPLLTIERALALRTAVSTVHMEESILEYAADLTRATRGSKGVSHGVSVRGGLQLVIAARALAFVRGRDFVTPADVSDLAVPVMAHRLCFESGEPEVERRRQLIEEILERVRPPR
jgi:MoxR-like ATPase